MELVFKQNPLRKNSALPDQVTFQVSDFWQADIITSYGYRTRQHNQYILDEEASVNLIDEWEERMLHEGRSIDFNHCGWLLQIAEQYWIMVVHDERIFIQQQGPYREE